jgi:hypothetical protein
MNTTSPSLPDALLSTIDDIISQVGADMPDYCPPYPPLLVEAMHLLLRVAERHQHKGASLIDLMFVGSRGLFKAIDTHEPALHGGFIGHAEPLIEQAIRRRFGDIQPDLPLPQGDEPPANVPNQEVP